MKTRLFFSPDNDNAAGASPAPVVPIESSPTGLPIPSAPAREPKPVEIVQPKPEIIKQPGIVDVKRALNLDKKPSEMLKSEAAEIRKRNDSTTIIPVPKIRAKKEPVAAEPVKPAGDTTPPPVPSAPAAEPVKLKIGDKEMTAEEIAKHVAELEAKIKAPSEPVKPIPDAPKPPEAAAPITTPEQQAADEKKLDEEFTAKLTEAYGLSQEQFDKMLANGDAKEFNAHIAKTLFAERKWLEQTLDPILRDLKDSIAPVMKMHGEVSQYQEEARFFSKFTDLKTHQEAVRELDAAARSAYPKEYAAMDEEKRHEYIANGVRDRIKKYGGNTASSPAATPPAAAPVAAVPTPTAAPTAPKPKPQPPTGNLGASGGAPVKHSAQGAQVAALLAAGY